MPKLIHADYRSRPLKPSHAHDSKNNGSFGSSTPFRLAAGGGVLFDLLALSGLLWSNSDIIAAEAPAPLSAVRLVSEKQSVESVPVEKTVAESEQEHADPVEEPQSSETPGAVSSKMEGVEMPEIFVEEIETPPADVKPSTHALVAVEADPRVKAYRLPSPAWRAAYDDVTGRLVLTDDKQNGLSFYKIDDILAGKLEPERSLTTRGPASALGFKCYGDKRFLVVASKLLSAVMFYDADSLEPIGEVPVKDPYYVGYLSTGSSPKDPYVYYMMPGRHDNIRPRPSEMNRGRIDVRTMEVDHDFHPDGGKSSFARLLSETTNPGFVPVVLGPHGNVVASDRNVYPRDMRTEGLRLDFAPQAFFHDRPVFVGLNKREILLGSSNDFSKLVSVPLDPGWHWEIFEDEEYANGGWLDIREKREKATHDKDFRWAYSGRCIAAAADDDRNLSIVVFHNALVILSLQAFDLPDEPSLLVKEVPPYDLYVDRELVVPLETGSEGVHYTILSSTLESDPPVIRGDVLRWTPTPKQVGLHRLKMRATKGETSHEWNWPFEVRQPHIALPFSVSGVSVEPSFRHLAVVWGSGKESGAWHLGVVDLKDKKLVSHRRVSRPVVAASMNLSDVYAIAALETESAGREAKSGSGLVRVSVPDLKTEGVAKLPEPARDCWVIGDRCLRIEGGGEKQRFKIPSLEPMELPFFGGRASTDYRHVNDGWLWDGVLWDEKMKSAKLLTLPVQFAPRSIINFKESTELLSEPIQLLGPIDFVSYGTLAMTPPRLQPKGFKFPKNPPSVCLEPKPEDMRGTYNPGLTPRHRIEWGDECLAVVFSGCLYAIPYSHFPLEGQHSFRIEPVQSELVLSVAKPTRVKYVAEGASKYTLELRLSPEALKPSVSETSEDGRFMISLRKVSDGLLLSAARLVAGSSWTPGRSSGFEMKRLEQYLEFVGEPYREITHQRLRGFPLLVYAKVTAEAPSGQTATLNHCYLVELPAVLVRDMFSTERNRTR